jgi:hypothetical protein
VLTQDRRSRIAASILACLAAVSIWLSLGTLAVISGDRTRLAALPSIWILAALMVVALAAASSARLLVDNVWPLAISLVLWLPFMPGPIPDAFLIFQGPIEAVIWIAVVAGLIVTSAPDIPPVIRDPRVAPWLAALLLCIAAVVTFSQVRGVVPGGDEPHYLAATQSLLHDGDLKVANNYAQGEYLDYFGGKLEPHFLKRSTSGEIYSIHAPGVSVIVLPGFAMAGYQGAIATMIAIAALTAALTWRLAFRVSQSAANAWIAIGSVFATTPYFFHTFTIYPEIIGGLLVMIGVWLLIELNDGRDVDARMLIAVGVALSILPWLHSRFAIIAAMLGLIIIGRLMQRAHSVQRIAIFLAVPVIAGLGWFTFFYVIWGRPSPAAPYGADTSMSASYILRGLIGLIVDQQFGVLTTAPIYLMSVAGAWMLFRRQSRFAVELALMVIPYAIAVSSYAMWWAGNAAPGRFLVALLPAAALPIAMVGSELVTILLLIVSVALAVPRAVFESGRLIFNNRGGVDATIEWITRSVDLSMALPSVHRDGASIALRDAGLWIVIFAAAVLAPWLFTNRRSMAVRYSATTIAAVVAMIVTSSVVWSLHGQPVVTPDRSKLAALAAYRPRWQWARQDFLVRMAVEVRPPARLNRVPAGDYDVVPVVAAQLSVGRNDPPIRDFDEPRRIHLPVALQTLNTSGPITFIPTGVARAATQRFAVRATRYRDVDAFFFDAQAYLEKDGFWMRANGSALVVFDVEDPARRPGLPISVTAGAVATRVTLSMGNWEQSYSLAAGQKQEVLLPPAHNGAWPVHIRSGDGFRPSERDPQSTDVRMLAAWIAVSGPATAGPSQ